MTLQFTVAEKISIAKKLAVILGDVGLHQISEPHWMWMNDLKIFEVYCTETGIGHVVYHPLIDERTADDIELYISHQAARGPTEHVV
jgi:hypothetical protein